MRRVNVKDWKLVALDIFINILDAFSKFLWFYLNLFEIVLYLFKEISLS